MKAIRAISGCLALSALLSSMWVGWRIWTTPVVSHPTFSSVGRDGRISETHSFSEMSLHPFVQLGIPVMLAGLASGLAWQERSGWLVVSTVCFYAMAFLQGFSIGAAYLPAAAALFAASALTLVGKLVAGLSTRAV
jgi:hypothetical protein